MRSRRNRAPVIERKPCVHHRPSRLDYLAWHTDADIRDTRGERQVQCPDCSYWFWRHEMGKKPRTAGAR